MSIKRVIFAPAVMLIGLAGCASTHEQALGPLEMGYTPGLVASGWADSGLQGWVASRNDARLGWPADPGDVRVVQVQRTTRDRQYTLNGRPRDYYRTTTRERELRRTMIR